MHFKKYLLNVLVILFVFIFLNQEIQSQVYRTTVKRFRPSVFTIEFIPSYSQPLPNLYGDMADFFNFTSYGTSSGVGTHINFKLAVDKRGAFRPMGTIGYNLLMGSGDLAYIGPNITESYPRPGSQQYQPVAGESKMYIHNFRLGLGTAYEFVNRRNKWVPYLNFTMDMNVIFGSYRQNPAGGTDEMTTYTIKNTVRGGFTFGGGVHLRLNRVVGLNLNTNYRYSNVVGKSSNYITEVNKMHLLDKAAPNLNTNLNEDRQIMYFDFGFGVSFFIGRK